MRFDPTNPNKVIIIPVTAPPKRSKRREQVIPQAPAPTPVAVAVVKKPAKLDLNSIVFDKPLGQETSIQKPEARIANIVPFPVARSIPAWRR